MLVIHEMTVDCAPSLSRLHAACFGEGWDEEYFRRLSLSPHAYGFVADFDHTSCGFILCQGVMDEAEILTLCVLPEYRHKSLGRQLLEKTMEYSKSLRVKVFFLEVAEDNFPAISLYTSCGFTKVSKRTNYYQTACSSKDAYLMRRDL
ncbi:MAG: ribosomal protein S18-alanine N-acetyltransferase [Holosporaceae bacterium]|jgi:ribosomal-protein-alanine N-acetyltransferase|nr:ribosomal protein S18-alanine N-acetyltransferase [Holosporaceae bacterium]